jgi:DNA-binding transcriptional LysR family regulator
MSEGRQVVIKIRQLDALRAVIESKSVTEAANSLYISQPAVSKLIAGLEQETKLKLFTRVGRTLEPTREAMILYENAASIYSRLREIDRLAGDLRNMSAGRLIIVTLLALGRKFVPDVMTEFMREHGKINASLFIHTSRTANDWVIGQQVDVGFSMLPCDHPWVETKVACRVAAVCVLPVSHALADKKEIVPEDLAGEDFISFSPDTDMRQRIDAVFDAVGIRREMHIDTYLSEAACRFVMSGLGVSIVDPFTAAELVGQGGMVVKPFSPKIPYHFYMHTPARRAPTLLGSEFARLAQSRFDTLVDMTGAEAM